MTSPVSADEAVARLAIEITALKRTAERDAAETTREIGIRLVAAKELLPTTGFGRFVEEALPFGISAAKNYMGLALWAQDHPQEFQRLKSLGPTKLYGLRAFPPQQLSELSLEEAYLVEDQNIPLEAMSTSEFRTFVLDTLGLPTAPSPEAVWGGFSRRVSGLIRVADDLMTHRGRIARDDAQAVSARLHALVADFDAVFLSDDS